MAKICPRCGALDSQREFVGAFCLNCFSERASLFEPLKSPELRQCTSCKKVSLAGNWTELDDGKLGEWVSEKLKAKTPLVGITARSSKAKNGVFVDAELVFSEGGHKIARKTSFLLRLKPGNCGECLKRSGGYHEAIIQLRGGNRNRQRKLAERLMQKISETSFVSGVEEKKEGIDFQVGDRRAAMSAVQRTGMAYTTAHKLIGVKQGKRVYRATICIRI